jgi:hypothetical protein
MIGVVCKIYAKKIKNSIIIPIKYRIKKKLYHIYVQNFYDYYKLRTSHFATTDFPASSQYATTCKQCKQQASRASQRGAPEHAVG